MLKKIIIALMLLPSIAFADCGFAMSGATMTIFVGKKADKCFSSSGFSEAFKSTVTDALEESDGRVVPQKRAFDERNASSNKLWAIAERQYQASSPTGRYFGQK